MTRGDGQTQTIQTRALTGISGLDQVLRGGFPQNRLYVIEGDPGAGKTTLALQFLLEGVRLGESVLYVTLSETAEELFEVAQSHGWSLDSINLLELNALDARFQDDSEYTVYHPADTISPPRPSDVREKSIFVCARILRRSTTESYRSRAGENGS
jgi:KaiC/GvpD/RAD55 family RecA-like ATPase